MLYIFMKAYKGAVIYCLYQVFILHFYKNMWNLQIPSKIKIHMWKLFNNFLLTRENLLNRRLPVEVRCPLCKVDTETSNHFLRFCDKLRQVWKGLKLAIPIDIQSLDVHNWLAGIFLQMNETKRKLFITSY